MWWGPAEQDGRCRARRRAWHRGPATPPRGSRPRRAPRFRQLPHFGRQGGHHERSLLTLAEATTSSHPDPEDEDEAGDEDHGNEQDGRGNCPAPSRLTGQRRPIQCGWPRSEQRGEFCLAEPLRTQSANGDRELVERAGEGLPHHGRHTPGLGRQSRCRLRRPSGCADRVVRIGGDRDDHHPSGCPVTDRGVGVPSVLDLRLGVEQVRDQAARRQR